MENQTFVSGKIKNYNPQKGFGFITTQEYGDVFFHQSILEKDFAPTEKQAVLVTVAPSSKKQGSFEATSVKLNPLPTEEKPAPPFYEGQVKFYDANKGFGIIITQEKGEVFFHSSKLDGNYIPKENDYVLAQVVPSKKKIDAFDASFVERDIIRTFINGNKSHFYALNEKEQQDLLQKIIENATEGQIFDIWWGGFELVPNIEIVYLKFSANKRPHYRKDIFSKLTKSKQEELLKLCQERCAEEDIFDIWQDNFEVVPNIETVYLKFSANKRRSYRENVFRKLTKSKQEETLKLCQERCSEEEIFDIWRDGFEVVPNINTVYLKFLNSYYRAEIFERSTKNQQNEILKLCQERCTEEEIYNIWWRGFEVVPNINTVYLKFLNSYDRVEIFERSTKNQQNEILKLCQERCTEEEIYNIWRDGFEVTPNIEIIYSKFLDNERSRESIMEKLNEVQKIKLLVKIIQENANLEELLFIPNIKIMIDIVHYTLGYNRDILATLYSSFFPNQNVLFFQEKFSSNWAKDRERERIKQFSNLFLHEIELKSKGLLKFKNIIKKNAHSATDLANFTFCPASYVIDQMYEVDFSEQENVFMGTQEHQKQRLAGLSDKDKWKPYKTDEKYMNFYKDFERIINADIVAQGHKENKPKIYYSKNKKITSIPDYIFKGGKGCFVVEEKYTFKPKDKLTNIYLNHKMQALAYLYGIADFEFDEAHLVYWFVVKDGENYKIDGYKIFKITKNEANKALLIDVFQKVEKLQNREEIAFDNQNINYKKCIKCNYFPYCEYKKGDKAMLKLPDIGQ